MHRYSHPPKELIQHKNNHIHVSGNARIALFVFAILAKELVQQGELDEYV